MSTLNTTVASMQALIDAVDAFLTGSAGFARETAGTTGGAVWSAAGAGANPGELYVQSILTAGDILDLRHGTGFGAGVLTGSLGYNTEMNLDAYIASITNAEIWGYANNHANEDRRYAHFAVEFNRDGRFAHFGFGHIDPTKKRNSWAGGAYVYGWNWDTAGNAENEPWAAGHKILLDGNHTNSSNTNNVGSLTVRNFLNQPAGGQFGVMTNATAVPSNDVAGLGVMKIAGYSRFGPEVTSNLHIRGTPNNAHFPLVRINLAAHGSTGSSTVRHPLGYMPDIFVCNIGNIQPKDIVVIGGTSYQFFPWSQKLSTLTAGVPASRHAGIAYQIVP